jgi:hypothetical protein
MENLLVYRVRFDTGEPVMSKFDQPLGTAKEADSAPH